MHAQAILAGPPEPGVQPDVRERIGPAVGRCSPTLRSTNGKGGRLGSGAGALEGAWAINGALTNREGNHSNKVGRLRRATRTAVPGSLATETALGGTFAFDNLFTSKNGTGGNELASLLLGLPATGSAPHDPATFEWYTRYWGGYFQDDWRVSSRFTLNYGLRLEHEDGLREVNNSQTVAFDQNAVNPIDALVPKSGYRC